MMMMGEGHKLEWPDVGGHQERNRTSLPSLAEERSKSRLFLHWWQRFLMVGIISLYLSLDQMLRNTCKIPFYIYSG